MRWCALCEQGEVHSTHRHLHPLTSTQRVILHARRLRRRRVSTAHHRCDAQVGRSRLPHRYSLARSECRAVMCGAPHPPQPVRAVLSPLRLLLTSRVPGPEYKRALPSAVSNIQYRSRGVEARPASSRRLVRRRVAQAHVRCPSDTAARWGCMTVKAGVGDVVDGRGDERRMGITNAMDGLVCPRDTPRARWALAAPLVDNQGALVGREVDEEREGRWWVSRVAKSTRWGRLHRCAPAQCRPVRSAWFLFVCCAPRSLHLPGTYSHRSTPPGHL